MKSPSFFPILVLLLFVLSGLHAQDIRIGIKGGENLDKMGGRSFTGVCKGGYTLGGYAEIGFGKWGLQPELDWMQVNLQTANNFNTIYPQYGGLNGANVTLNNLSIPILLTFRPIKVLSILAGPQFDLLSNQEGNVAAYTQHAFREGNFSITGGVQLNLSRFKLGARYFLGLSELNGLNSTLDSWKNQGLLVYLGFRLH